MMPPGNYIVDKIVRKRVDRTGKRVYLVKWKNYSEAENSWEPEENLEDVIEMLQEFNKEFSVQQDQNLLSDSDSLEEAKKEDNDEKAKMNIDKKPDIPLNKKKLISDYSTVRRNINSEEESKPRKITKWNENSPTSTQYLPSSTNIETEKYKNIDKSSSVKTNPMMNNPDNEKSSLTHRYILDSSKKIDTDSSHMSKETKELQKSKLMNIVEDNINFLEYGVQQVKHKINQIKETSYKEDQTLLKEKEPDSSANPINEGKEDECLDKFPKFAKIKQLSKILLETDNIHQRYNQTDPIPSNTDMKNPEIMESGTRELENNERNKLDLRNLTIYSPDLRHDIPSRVIGCVKKHGTILYAVEFKPRPNMYIPMIGIFSHEDIIRHQPFILVPYYSKHLHLK